RWRVGLRRRPGCTPTAFTLERPNDGRQEGIGNRVVTRGSMMRWFLFALLVPGLFIAPASGDLEVPRDGFEFAADLTGRGEKMNHGPFLSYSLISAYREEVKATGKKKEKVKINSGLRTGKPAIILRAINIRLGGPHMAAFDTEMCGFAVAWSGGFLD